MTHTEAVDLFRYTDWANAQVFDALLKLDPEHWTREIGGSFPTITGLAAHLISADWVWLERWKGISPDRRPNWITDESLPELRKRMEAIGGERQTLVDGLGEGQLQQIVEYRNLSGMPQRQPLEVLFRHVINHSTYHRGQLVMMLRMSGSEAPGTDLVHWYPEPDPAS